MYCGTSSFNKFLISFHSRSYLNCFEALRSQHLGRKNGGNPAESSAR